MAAISRKGTFGKWWETHERAINIHQRAAGNLLELRRPSRVFSLGSLLSVCHRHGKDADRPRKRPPGLLRLRHPQALASDVGSSVWGPPAPTLSSAVFQVQPRTWVPTSQSWFRFISLVILHRPAVGAPGDQCHPCSVLHVCVCVCVYVMGVCACV